MVTEESTPNEVNPGDREDEPPPWQDPIRLSIGSAVLGVVAAGITVATAPFQIVLVVMNIATFLVVLSLLLLVGVDR